MKSCYIIYYIVGIDALPDYLSSYRIQMDVLSLTLTLFCSVCRQFFGFIPECPYPWELSEPFQLLGCPTLMVHKCVIRGLADPLRSPAMLRTHLHRSFQPLNHRWRSPIFVSWMLHRTRRPEFLRSWSCCVMNTLPVDDLQSLIYHWALSDRSCVFHSCLYYAHSWRICAV